MTQTPFSCGKGTWVLLCNALNSLMIQVDDWDVGILICNLSLFILYVEKKCIGLEIIYQKFKDLRSTI